MPQRMPFSTLVRVRAGCLGNNQFAVNVRHYLCTQAVGTGALDSELAQALSNALAPLHKGMMSTGASYRGVGVQIINPEPTKVEAISIAGQGAGTVLGGALPPQTAGLVMLKTDLAGPAGRGFIYAPFPGGNDNQPSGTPGAAYQTALSLLADEWLRVVTVGAAGNTSTMTPVLLNRKTHVSTQYTGKLVKLYWSQQKRRSFLRKGGTVPI